MYRQIVLLSVVMCIGGAHECHAARSKDVSRRYKLPRVLAQTPFAQAAGFGITVAEAAEINPLLDAGARGLEMDPELAITYIYAAIDTIRNIVRTLPQDGLFVERFACWEEAFREMLEWDISTPGSVAKLDTTEEGRFKVFMTSRDGVDLVSKSVCRLYDLVAPYCTTLKDRDVILALQALSDFCVAVSPMMPDPEPQALRKPYSSKQELEKIFGESSPDVASRVLPKGSCEELRWFIGEVPVEEVDFQAKGGAGDYDIYHDRVATPFRVLVSNEKAESKTSESERHQGEADSGDDEEDSSSDDEPRMLTERFTDAAPSRMRREFYMFISKRCSARRADAHLGSKKRRSREGDVVVCGASLRRKPMVCSTKKYKTSNGTPEECGQSPIIRVKSV